MTLDWKAWGKEAHDDPIAKLIKAVLFYNNCVCAA